MDRELWRRDGRIHYLLDPSGSPLTAFVLRALGLDTEGWPVHPLQGWGRRVHPFLKGLLAELAADPKSTHPKFDWVRSLVPAGMPFDMQYLIDPPKGTRWFEPAMHVVCDEDTGEPFATATFMCTDALTCFGAPPWVADFDSWLACAAVDIDRPGFATDAIPTDEKAQAYALDAIAGAALSATLAGKAYMACFRTVPSNTAENTSYLGVRVMPVWEGPYCAGFRQLDGSQKPMQQFLVFNPQDVLDLFQP